MPPNIARAKRALVVEAAIGCLFIKQVKYSFAFAERGGSLNLIGLYLGMKHSIPFYL